mgnify:CR=1 FL=1
MPLRLVSYNIRFGGRGREALIAQVLRAAAPDVVILQEATHPYVVERVAHELEMPFWSSRERRSLAFISRVPVHHEWHVIDGTRHAFLQVSVDGQAMTVIGAHLQPHLSRWSERVRVREVQSLIGVAEEVAGGGLHALVGDFNAVAPGDQVEAWRMPLWIKLLIRLSGGRILREAIRALIDAGYVDGYRQFFPQGGFTFPAIAPHIRFDYVFTPARYAANLKACAVLREPATIPIASDHCPLLAVFAP